MRGDGTRSGDQPQPGPGVVDFQQEGREHSAAAGAADSSTGISRIRPPAFDVMFGEGQSFHDPTVGPVRVPGQMRRPSIIGPDGSPLVTFVPTAYRFAARTLVMKAQR
jgi:hypothetical protein